jgi:hypothetical protein
MDNSKTAPVAEATQMAPETIPHGVTHDEDDQALAKRVLRKIDWRLIPLMFITYNLNFMDKTILSSASVFGLREDTVSSLM